MADVAAALWKRALELASVAYESIDVVDLWFLTWVSLSLFGMLIVRLVTHYTMGRHSRHSPPDERKAIRAEESEPRVESSVVNGEVPKNTASESDDGETCQWLNVMIAWLTNGASSGSASLLSLVSVWLAALNEAVRDTKGTSQQLLFERTLPGGSPPTFTGIRVQPGNGRTMTLLAGVRCAGTSLRVVCGRRFAEQAYAVTLHQLDSQVRMEVAQSDSQLSVSVQFVDTPQMKLDVSALESSSNSSNQSQRRPSLNDASKNEQQRSWIEARVTRAVRECVLKLNLNTAVAPNRSSVSASSTNVAQSQQSVGLKQNEVELETVAKSSKATFASPDSSGANTVTLNGSGKTSKSLPAWNGAPARPGDRRLLLKVVKASGLGAREFGCRSAHCLATVDDPPQRHQTPSVRGTVNPFWDAHFLFDLNSRSAKLTFEIYDDDGVGSDNPNACRFLGQAVLSLDVLHDVPSSRQMLPLRSRPGAPDNSTGTVTVELLVLEPADFEALPITAQAHEYTLPKVAVNARNSSGHTRSSSATNGNFQNGATASGNTNVSPNVRDTRRVIVETSRMETAHGDIITTSRTMQEKTPGDDAPPPVPQRTSSLADAKEKTPAATTATATVTATELSVTSEHHEYSVPMRLARKAQEKEQGNKEQTGQRSTQAASGSLASPDSPKRTSRPLTSLFKRKSGVEKDRLMKDRNDSQSPRADSNKKGKKHKEGKSHSKDLEQATLVSNNDDDGSLKRSKSSGLSGSFRRLFGSSVRDKTKRSSGSATRNAQSALESPS